MLYKKIEKHLGTEIEIQIVSESNSSEADIGELFFICADFEKEFSRFKEDSPLSQLNKKKQLTVSQRFLDILEISLLYKEKTLGYFSPFVDIASLGYSQSFETGIFTPSELKNNENQIQIDGKTIYLGDKTILDFGGIGKGFLVDLLSENLRQKGYSNFCVNAGGDISLSGNNNSGDVWTIGIENPFGEDNIGIVRGTNISINTSGSYRRKWNISETSYHHIVDPFTGENKNSFISTTLISTSCTYGDVFTKGVWHTPFDELLEYFRTHSLEGVVIRNDGKVFASPGMVSLYQLHMF